MTTPRISLPALRRMLAGGLLAVGLLAPATGPASAQGFYYAQPTLPPRSIAGMLRQQGFTRLSQPILNRDVYFLDAIDPYGQPMRIIVSAFNGQIVAAHPQRGRGGVTIDPDDEDDWPPPRRRDWARRDPGVWPVDPRLSPPELPDETPEIGPRRTPAPPRDSRALPPLPSPSPADRSDPLPTPKNPTVVKRSPTALPKDGASTTDSPGRLSPAPGMGTRDKPRVIELAPKPAAPPASAAPPTATAPLPKLEAPATPPASPAPPVAAPAPAASPVPTPQAAAPPPANLAPPPAIQTAPDSSQTIKDYRALPPAILD